ncbi:MAG: phosphoglycerate dehydrogenase [Planctomycetaceae bacterium]|jgi:D-3-phosphoglycerate dehydrogenase|nr:phosphoglycerate dehydrogenase [Planctomycetaceae bacterium]
MPRIVLLDPLSDDGISLMKKAGIEYEERIGLKGDELRKVLNEFDGAIARSGVKITAESLEGNTRLRAIARAGVGVDNIDTKAATRRGIIVMNTPGGNTVSTAEQTFALMLALSRNTHPAYQALVEGRWDRKLFTGTQLAGKVLGIVGMGRIGQVVAGYARAFDMKVIALDPFLTAARAEEIGVTMVSALNDMLPQIDYLTVHTPLNDATRGMFGKKELEIVKPGCRLINCARGGIYDIDALVEGIESGKLGGVALDVFESEPCTQNPLYGKKNVLCTPHLGASTEEAQANVAIEAVELLIDYLQNGRIRQAVNFISLDAETLKNIRGYLDVAYRIGLFAFQIVDGTPETCKLTYRGEIAKKETSLISTAFAAGFLTAAMSQDVNIVSAASLLQERGINVIEEKSSEIIHFNSLMSVEITANGKTTLLSGTVFGNAMPRLVNINGFRMESFLDGIMLVFEHMDVPGVIGEVGGIFGRAGINIASMTIGRESDQPGKEAIGIIHLDSAPDKETLKEMLTQKAIKMVKLIHLPIATDTPAWMG